MLVTSSKNHGFENRAQRSACPSFSAADFLAIYYNGEQIRNRMDQTL